MARQWKIEYPGALYHVLSRGNGRQDIFLSDDDRILFLSLLEELSDRSNIEMCVYGLMGNQKDVELPQYNQLVRAVDPELLLKNASGVLDVDLESARHVKKIVPGEKVRAFSDRMQAESELRAKFDLRNSQFDI